MPQSDKIERTFEQLSRFTSEPSNCVRFNFGAAFLAICQIGVSLEFFWPF